MTSTIDPQTWFCLHFLGGSARSWLALADSLGPDHRCIGIDLPGFGDAADDTGYAVDEMADAAATVIDNHEAASFGVMGHSMGGKIAAVLARRAAQGDVRLQGLEKLVLLAASPPGPEPIPDEKRAQMLGWAGPGGISERDAETFIAGNVGGPLPDQVHKTAIDDVRRMSIDAWNAWLDHGSREDHADRVGVLDCRTLILAGSADDGLGENEQQRLTLPHFSDARLLVVEGAGHLLPMEKPRIVAALIREFS